MSREEREKKRWGPGRRWGRTRETETERDLRRQRQNRQKEKRREQKGVEEVEVVEVVEVEEGEKANGGGGRWTDEVVGLVPAFLVVVVVAGADEEGLLGPSQWQIDLQESARPTDAGCGTRSADGETLLAGSVFSVVVFVELELLQKRECEERQEEEQVQKMLLELMLMEAEEGRQETVNHVLSRLLVLELMGCDGGGLSSSLTEPNVKLRDLQLVVLVASCVDALILILILVVARFLA
ncbi:hypothetical protein ACJ41O_010116 [Fusarium nematophilum]